jgi:hypothetical protein
MRRRIADPRLRCGRSSRLLLSQHGRPAPAMVSPLTPPHQGRGPAPTEDRDSGGGLFPRGARLSSEAGVVILVAAGRAQLRPCQVPQRHANEERQLLAPVYGRFTEGFETRFCARQKRSRTSYRRRACSCRSGYREPRQFAHLLWERTMAPVGRIQPFNVAVRRSSRSHRWH